MKAISHKHLFSKGDWYTAGTATVLALTFYLSTLAPTVTLEQSGAFTVAGEHMGIGRVPGYPLWHLLAKAFITIFSFVTYRGYPNPAWATNFMSAFFGALSCGLVALLVCRIGQTITQQPGESKSRVAAVIAGSLFAVSNAMWSQSVITETYSMTVFFILLFLVACLTWLNKPDHKTAYLLAAVFGLGLAVSEIIILLLPSLLLVLFLGRTGLTCKTTVIMLLIIALCLSLYAYLPLASEGFAPMQFGYARTWIGFKHIINRGQYERINAVPVFSLQYLKQLAWYRDLLMGQYIIFLEVLGLIPIIKISRFRDTWKKWWFVCLLSFFIFSLIYTIGICPKGDTQDSFIQRVRYIPSFAMWSIFIGLGITLILEKIECYLRADNE